MGFVFEMRVPSRSGRDAFEICACVCVCACTHFRVRFVWCSLVLFSSLDLSVGCDLAAAAVAARHVWWSPSFALVVN